MTIPEQTPAESANCMTPLEYLANADKEWAAGNDREAAGLLWVATRATFIGLAREKGYEDDEHLLRLARELDATGSKYDDYFRLSLGVAKLMRDHYEMDVLEGYELESTFKLSRQFVEEQFGQHR